MQFSGRQADGGVRRARFVVALRVYRPTWAAPSVPVSVSRGRVWGHGSQHCKQPVVQGLVTLRSSCARAENVTGRGFHGRPDRVTAARMPARQSPPENGHEGSTSQPFARGSRTRLLRLDRRRAGPADCSRTGREHRRSLRDLRHAGVRVCRRLEVVGTYARKVSGGGSVGGVSGASAAGTSAGRSGAFLFWSYLVTPDCPERSRIEQGPLLSLSTPRVSTRARPGSRWQGDSSCAATACS